MLVGLTLENYIESVNNTKVILSDYKSDIKNFIEFKIDLISIDHRVCGIKSIFYRDIISIGYKVAYDNGIDVKFYFHGGEFKDKNLNNFVHKRMLYSARFDKIYSEQAKEFCIIISTICELFKLEKQKMQVDSIKRLQGLPSYSIALDKSAEFKKNRLEDMPEINIARISRTFDKSFLPNFVVIHVETTGLSPENGDEIIELSAIKFIEFEPKEKFSTYIKPHFREVENTEFNDITNDMVKDAPFIEEVRDSFIQFLGKNPIVDYRVMFTLKFLHAYGFSQIFTGKRKYYDVYSYIKRLKSYELEELDLNSVCEAFHITHYGKTALSDCLATGNLFSAVIDEIVKETF